MNSLIWFRRDLRVADNQALLEACDYARSHDGRVYALYISTPKQWLLHDIAPIQIDFIERQLNQLALSLAELGIEFEAIEVDGFSGVPTLISHYCQSKKISSIYASVEPEFDERIRDSQVAKQCLADNISWTLFDDHSLMPTGSILNQAGTMFKVFTPFSKKWREQLLLQSIVPFSSPKPLEAKLNLALLNSVNKIALNYEKQSSQQWQVGETYAHKLLNDFIAYKASEYANGRDFPAVNGTSSLSPCLAIGVISPKQCIAALLNEFPDALINKDSAGWTWVNEICWRDFYRHLLVAFPDLSKGKNFNQAADNIQWLNNKIDFDKWCKGQTGYPIVDAAMRQLNETGWMHNRLRMISASFLVKDLLIDWRWGERYFKRKLIDGDLASNNGGWQWAAGTGCDAQPYFRIFNPMSQSEKFDPSAEFICRYVPELSHYTAKEIHGLPEQNTEASCQTPSLFESNNLSTSYPAAIIDHKFARQRALEAFSVMKAKK